MFDKMVFDPLLIGTISQNDAILRRRNYFGNKMLCSSSFSGDSMSSYDTLEVKAAASHQMTGLIYHTEQ